MRKVFLPLLFALGIGSPLSAQTGASGLPTVYGSVIFGLKWEQMENPPYGVYAVSPDNGAGIAAVVTGAHLKANGGGVYADGTYYAVNYETDAMGTDAWLRAYDVENGWALKRQVHLTSLTSVATDLAYDPAADVIYGCFWKNNSQYTLGTLDPVTGATTVIGDLSEQLFTLASTREGELYGIGEYGTLYKVDKTTAVLTAIGSTGKTIRYAQSATFDYATGRLVWAMTPHDFSQSVELCEVDVKTGETKTLTEVPNRYELTGIFTKSPFTLDGAPARPGSLKMDFPKGALTGDVSFSLPAQTFGGTALSADGLTYTVLLDGAAVAQDVSARPGDEIKFAPTLTQGMHSLKIAAANATGRSPYLRADFWAGKDAAKALNPQGSLAGDGTMNLSWDAPTVGAHGGYIDTSDLSYKVERTPDGKVVYEGKATSCNDASVPSLNYGYYRYCVTAFASGEKGDTALTEEYTLGRATPLPYTQDFSDASKMELMSIIDANGDGYTWAADGGAMVYSFSENRQDADDWLVTPPFTFDTEHVYQLAFDAKTDEGATETVGAYMGSLVDSRSLTTELLAPTAVTSADYKRIKANFRPSKDATRFVGLHVTSTYKEGSNLVVDNLSVSELASVKAPAAPTSVSAEAGANGTLRATLRFTLPATDIDGGTLASIDHVDIVRESDDMVVGTLEDVQPGGTYSYEVSESAAGERTYSVTAYNDYDGGMPAVVTVFVGNDKPGQVRSLKAEGADDGTVTLSWQAPDGGEHGGYMDSSSLKYRVTNVGGVSSKTATVESTGYTDKLTLSEGVQKLAWYTVAAQNAAGRGKEAYTDTIFVGAPYSLPLKESFSRRGMDNGPWNIVSSSAAEWMLLSEGTYASPADEDGGLMAFTTLVEGAEARLVSPKFAVSGSKYPRLAFYVWHMAQCRGTLAVSVRDAKGVLHEIGTVTPSEGTDTLAENKGEWREHVFNLGDYTAESYIQLVFTGRGGDTDDVSWFVPIYLDKISVIDQLDYSLRMLQISTKDNVTRTEVGEPLEITATLANSGAKTASGYTVRLYRNGAEIASVQGADISAGSYGSVVFTDTPNGDAAESSEYSAVIDWEDDANKDDNTSNTLQLTILPGKPYVSALSAVRSGDDAVLSWQRPAGADKGTTAETVTEGFESYFPFTITNFGEWTLYDGDKQTTLGIQDGTGYFVQYPNVESPMAYQVFNPSSVSLSALYYSAHKGTQCAAAFSAGRYTANDDWLISPEVDGAQTVTFWACSPDNAWFGTSEQVELMYSTTGRDVADFTRAGELITVPGRWTEYSRELPAGTRYFALHCVSLDQYILFLDDITYRKAARDFRLLGYNVYRDGTLVNAAPLSAPSYTDAGAGNRASKYTVTAVYNVGESVHSPAAAYDPTGIESVSASSESWRVSAQNGRLAVSSAPAGRVSVYDASGRKLHEADGAFAVTLPSGAYLLRSGESTYKAVVR